MKINNKGFALSSVVYSILILFLLLIFAILSILGSRKLLLDKTKNNVLNKLNQEKVEDDNSYKDASGANAPELLDGMVPIKYSGTNWIVADLKYEWYNYGNKQWANAVILSESADLADGIVDETDIALWYVWIPRFNYTLFNTNGSLYSDCTSSTCPIINIKFESGIETTGTVSCIQDLDSTLSKTLSKTEICSDITGLIDGTSTYTHPAFTLGDKELTGFWIGKFDLSKNDKKNKLEILPGKKPLEESTEEWFALIKNIDYLYNINGDSHMIKNIEWGAVAYLKQSQYGLGIVDIIANNAKIPPTTGYGQYKTGYGQYKYYNTSDGQGASTTGNIYGVYDMAGYEKCVMGIFQEIDINQKYFDKYNEKYPYKLGDATIETKTFYVDRNISVGNLNRFYLRGGGTYGAVPGIFAYSLSDDECFTKAVLTK